MKLLGTLFILFHVVYDGTAAPYPNMITANCGTRIVITSTDYSFSKINALNFELGNIGNKGIPNNVFSLFSLYDANATYVRNPCVIIDRFSSVENLNFSHSRKLIGMVVQTTNASTAVVVGPRGEIIADVICEEYVVKLRQSHNKKQIFYMLPDDKHSVYGFDRTWGFSKWLGCAFETKIRTVQLYVSIQKRSPSSDKATCEDALRNAQARSSYENQDRSYDAYHGHPVIIIPSSGTALGNLACRKKKSEQFLQKIETTWNIHIANNLTTYLPNNLAWMDCIRQSLKDIHKYETYVPDFGQLRGSDMQFLFLGQNLDNWHYEPGVSIRTASYDFRKLPHQLQYYYVDLKHLIEETYRSNGGRKVVLATFYTGGIYAMTFLNHHVSQAWKDEYIASLVTIGTPWLGTVGAILPYLKSYSYIKQCVKSYREKYKSELENRTLDTEEQVLKELPSTVVGLPYMSSRAVFNS